MGDNLREVKHSIREHVWRLLEEEGVAAFPLPVRGRIPNFKGAERAAAQLCSTKEYAAARVVKVNPDSPQREVRLRCLIDNKILIMPTPRLRDGFLLIHPSRIPRNRLREAATIKGAFVYGRKTQPGELPDIDLIVIGSVAVSKHGDRIGKGEGYAELEYGILREFGKVSENTPIYTTVHELQIVESIPREPYDVTVDAIFTPSRTIAIKVERNRPPGILWDLLPQQKIREIPLLEQLYRERG